ncbi:MAG: sensor histidine kinase [Bryobacteraceae bacterium]|nr:MAG: sensor histidine kinase [Bryobacteraceae bacterium]
MGNHAVTPRLPRIVKPLLLAASIVLPLVLVLSARRTLRELETQREVYLRSRAAAIAAMLETMPPGAGIEAFVEDLKDREPGLVEIVVIDRESPDSAELADLWNGRELFRTARIQAGGMDVMRSWVPFHMAGGLRIARIDVAGSAADFLLVHGRHNVLIATVGGLVLVCLSLLTFWIMRRAAGLEQKQLEMEHLARIGQMAAVLAHEIRNPLGTIKGFAQLLAERLEGADRALAEPMISECARLEGLVHGLLLYGRPPQPELRATSSGAIREILEMHAAQLTRGGGVRIVFDVPPVTFRTDPNLLQQVLLNLVRNAVEAVEGRPGAEVSVRLETGRRSLAWVVSDNGPGLPREIRDRLFEPFATTKSSGTGLGLAISKRLAEALSGSLAISGDSRGTEARVTLPAGV